MIFLQGARRELFFSSLSPYFYFKIMVTKNNLKLLEELVSLETITGKQDNQKKAISLIEKNLPKFFQKSSFSRNGYPSALFYSKNKKKFDILFVVHVDVVDAKKELFKMKKAKDRLYGRGVYDMKGPILSCIIAINNFFEKKRDLSVGLIVTSDEERGGYDGTGLIIEKTGLSAKVAIVPDGGRGLNSLVIEQKGVLDLTLSYKGVSAHVAEPWKGKNSISKIIEVIGKIEQKFSTGDEKKWGTTVSPVNFNSHFIAQNVIPDNSESRIIFRYTKKDSFEKISKFIKKIDKDIKIKVNVQGDPFKTDPENYFLRSYCNIVSSRTKKRCIKEKYHSASDGRFLSSIGVPTIITRPSGGGIHGENEWVSIKSLALFSEILTDFLNKISASSHLLK